MMRKIMTSEMRAGKTGKGTTSVVPLNSTMAAALAAEGEFNHLVEGSRFTI
jgi:hypothetical protein